MTFSTVSAICSINCSTGWRGIFGSSARVQCRTRNRPSLGRNSASRRFPTTLPRAPSVESSILRTSRKMARVRSLTTYWSYSQTVSRHPMLVLVHELVDPPQREVAAVSQCAFQNISGRLRRRCQYSNNATFLSKAFLVFGMGHETQRSSSVSMGGMDPCEPTSRLCGRRALRTLVTQSPQPMHLSLEADCSAHPEGPSDRLGRGTVRADCAACGAVPVTKSRSPPREPPGARALRQR